MKIVRTIKPSSLWRLCVINNWYTEGNADHLINLMDHLFGNITSDALVAIVNDIIEHSTFASTREEFRNVANQVLGISKSFVIMEDEYEIE